MARRPRCAYCRRAFTPAKHGLQKYCCRAHRQRAYVTGRRAAEMPSLLLGRDIDYARWRTEVERIVFEVLRSLDAPRPRPQPRPRPRLRVVPKDE